MLNCIGLGNSLLKLYWVGYSIVKIENQDRNGNLELGKIVFSLHLDFFFIFHDCLNIYIEVKSTLGSASTGSPRKHETYRFLNFLYVPLYINRPELTGLKDSIKFNNHFIIFGNFLSLKDFLSFQKKVDLKSPSRLLSPIFFGSICKCKILLVNPLIYLGTQIEPNE